VARRAAFAVRFVVSTHGVIRAKLRFSDDLGSRVPVCIDLNVCTLSQSRAGRPLGRGARHRLSIEDIVDSVGQFGLALFRQSLALNPDHRLTRLQLKVPDLNQAAFQ
jgi:hypothetical protein